MDINDIILSNIDIILITCKKISENDFFLPVVFPEFLGRAALLLLEDAVEVGQVVEPALVTDLGHIPCGIHKHPGGKAKTDVDYVVRQGTSCPDAEETAEGHWAHTYKCSQAGKGQRLVVVIVYILLNLLNPTAFRTS